MAKRGLQAYAVPSARVGQRPDPSARRDALTGLMTGGFLMAVIAMVLVIVIAAPPYAEPAAGGLVASPSVSPSPSASPLPGETLVAPRSTTPDKLRGYRWPVRGGRLIRYYDWDKGGDFSIQGKRVHAGLDISWFCRPSSLHGAIVKAAHKGTVLAAGTDWAESVGFDGPLDAYYRTLRKQRGGLPNGVVIDDLNDYLSVYKYLDEVLVKPGQSVKPGQPIGTMGSRDGVCHIEYQLVRSDGLPMKVAPAARRAGLPDYAPEHVDPLVVMNLEARKLPDLTKRPPPADPPRLSDY